MELELTLQPPTQRCMTLTHHTFGSTMHFHKKNWKFFHREPMIDRLSKWRDISWEDEFRSVIDWITEGEELRVALAPIPEGFLSFSHINNCNLDDFDKTKLIFSLTQALAKLHKNQFHMGFLVPDYLYFHPVTLAVILDVQPYASAYPFVNNLLDDFPYILFSNYSRKHEMSRICDFYSIGLMMQWVFLGRLPIEPRSIDGLMPHQIHLLCHRLMNMPESFIFADEIADELANLLDEAVPHPTEQGVQANVNWLHPVVPPIDRKSQNVLRSFFQGDGLQILGIFGEDEVTRLNVLKFHVQEVLEYHFFFTIRCKNLPFAALCESIEHTLYMAYQYLPEATSKLRSLARKFERLLRRHFEGDDLVHTLADWLYSFYTEILPLFQLQSLYYIYEDCECIDEDSQRVLLMFWQRYGQGISGLHAIFNGTNRPNLFPQESFYGITLGQKKAALYRNILISQLGRADTSLLQMLSDWMMDNQIEYHYCPIVLEELIQAGGIQLSTQGWTAAPACYLVLPALKPDQLLEKRINKLSIYELDLLRTLACMPHPIKARSMLVEDGLDDTQFFTVLNRLSRSGLVLAHSDDHLFIPFEVAKKILHDLPVVNQVAYYRQALPLLQKVRYLTYPTLIEVARLAEETRVEYYYLIRYYRQIRNLLTVERRRVLIENLRQLQHKLNRTHFLCWDRLLCQVYMRLNMYAQAEKLAESLYQRTSGGFDRFILLRIRLFTNQLDIVSARQSLLDFLEDPTQTLLDKAHAANLLIYFDFFAPLHREKAEILHHLYLQEFHPNRHLLSTRTFAELSITYTIMLFQYFPEQEEWASALLDKIESVLEGSPHQDLMIELSNSFIFHSNIRLSRRYIQRCLDISRRYGFKGKEQISHLNGMEISLYQGDVTSFRYHLQHVPLVDELHRKDLNEQFHTHQLFYACEWEQWELFDEIFTKLLEQQPTNSASFLMEVYKRYAAYRKGETLPPPCQWEQPNEYTYFVDGLYLAQSGNLEAAYEAFLHSIAANGYRLQTGWSYREMLELMLKENYQDIEVFLERFEEYLKKYGYDVFWPDLHRGYAYLSMYQGDLQRAMLYLRRSVNGYQLIEKDTWSRQLSDKLDRIAQPTYIPRESAVRDEPIVQQLMDERTKFLHQSLDLQIIIQLSEQVTESLELANTFHQLSNALFRFFPVNHTSISCDLFYQKETLFYSASGLIDKNEEIMFQRSRYAETKYDYTLYQQGDQYIKLNVFAKDMVDTKLQHMEHFLSFIKPHVANALHYMEMMIDNLTGFYQRRYFNRKLAEELEASLAYGLDLSLIMIDIDNFRKVNEFGHQEGDKVLRELADIVRSILRRKDIPGRFGGEELLLILPKTDGNIAYRMAEELRQQIEEEFASGRPYQVTISAGVASTELCQAKSIDELIRFADNAEIKAKTTGKNKVVVAWE